jgi:riboflavin kinase/FMN adenylyltransferase
MEGLVVSGYQVGRKLGFPTINVKPLAGGLIPRRGVYVTDVFIGGNLYRAVTNVGTRPTFTDADIVSIERHLLTFQGDLYGEEAEVRFLRYLRPERSFENGEALRAQIAADIEEARKTK